MSSTLLVSKTNVTNEALAAIREVYGTKRSNLNQLVALRYAHDPCISEHDALRGYDPVMEFLFYTFCTPIRKDSVYLITQQLQGVEAIYQDTLDDSVLLCYLTACLPEWVALCRNTWIDWKSPFDKVINDIQTYLEQEGYSLLLKSGEM